MTTKPETGAYFTSSIGDSILRWSVALVFAFGCVLLASHFMTTLITPGDIEKKIYNFLSVDFVRIEPNKVNEPEFEKEIDPPKEQELKPPKPELQQQAVAIPNLPKLSIAPQSLASISLPLSFAPPSFSPDAVTPTKQVTPIFNEQLFPLLTPSPTYPRRAKRARIEGWVNIGFTITIDGNVDNVEVISAEPEGIFERNTLRAVQNWKYKPQLLSGKPTARRVVQTIHFALEK